MNTPSLVRLTTGEDLIAVIEPNDGFGIDKDRVYTLTRPVRIFAQPDQSGKLAVAFGDFPPFSDTNVREIEITGRHIMFVMPADKRLIASYQQATTSIIQPSSSGLKLI